MSNSSLAEHTDVLLYLLLGLISLIAFLLKKWDMSHTKALACIVDDMKTLSIQVSMLAKEFYELRGEHNAHHVRRRVNDERYDECGFEKDHVGERHHK